MIFDAFGDSAFNLYVSTDKWFVYFKVIWKWRSGTSDLL